MEPLKTGLDGLKQISNQLRLPLNHEWDFGIGATPCNSRGCAILTTHIAWPEQVRVPCLQSVAESLGFSREELCPLFGMEYSKEYYGHVSVVIPSDVADAIDAYIAKHQPPLPTLAIIITTPQKSARVTL